MEMVVKDQAYIIISGFCDIMLEYVLMVMISCYFMILMGIYVHSLPLKELGQ